MTWQERSDAAITGVMLATFDHRPEWRQTQTPNTVRTVRGHRRFFGTDELEFINAYGEKGCEIICDLASFYGDQPEKFDVFVVGGESYTVQAVRIQEGFQNTPLIARCFCRGG